MKILSWNVNGLRAVIKKGFADFLKKERPDILCLQEIKIDELAIKKAEFNFPGYAVFWNPAERKGYSGTAVLLRLPPKARRVSGKGGIILPKLRSDREGRIQVIDSGNFYLANIYFPNANHELSRLEFKLGFNDSLLSYLKKLEKSKPVVVCGDFNVAHAEIDLARPKSNVGNPGFTREERDWMTKFLNKGYVDTFRYFFPDKIAYTWWSQRFNTDSRAKNIGWRIDYFCVSGKAIKRVKRAFIMDKIMGSDHCPVGIEIA
ncbi:MAG: exodeoxyribonuclease III [Candidatus Falkowbacteria bacterium]